ncbi:hypothetical protein [Roseibium sediminicola]|uniref:DUF2125 domain-containing protein n=1 Tax=Roseibium sediminicola TaxID=2933272 RepID=A0ABT0GMN9_9HYPH|nr:hypothetical protein [Roseibium sp. CAU 1639]MCK7610685.1 hypothetical protein [Roseibium sp. CAU 1639]
MLASICTGPGPAFAEPAVTVGGGAACYQSFYVQDLGNHIIKKPTGTARGPDQADTFDLRYSREKGDRFSHQAMLEIQIEPGPVVKEQLSELTMTMRDFVIEDRKANGDTVVSTSISRLLKAKMIAGAPAFLFDSGYDEQIEQARTDPDFPPEYKAALSNLDLSYAVTLSPAGELTDFEIEHPDPVFRETVEATAEDSLASGFVKFPQEPVAIGAAWAAGTRTMNIPNVGSVSFELEGKLSSVFDVEGLGEIDIVELEPTAFTFTPAMASNFEMTSIDIKVSHLYAFSPSVGFVIYQHAFASVSAEATIDGATEQLELCVINGTFEIKDGSYSAKGRSSPRPRLVVFNHPQTGTPLLFVGR